MRSRNIKPGFFINDDLGELSVEARFLFIGLWCLADREGCFAHKPKKIKAQIFPYDDIKIEPLLATLVTSAFVQGYKYSSPDNPEAEIHFYQIVNFTKHQRPHYNEIPSVYKDIIKLATKVTSTCDQGNKRLFLNDDILNKDILNEELGKRNDPGKATPAFLDDSLEISLSKYLFEKLQARNPKEKEPNFQVWAGPVDLMLRLDNRTPTEIQQVIDWSQEDEFWQNNIASTAKLRKQFDALWRKMESGSQSQLNQTQKSILESEARDRDRR